MKIKIFGGLLVAALAITSMAQAQDRTPVRNYRQRNQESRINQGERSSEFTDNGTYNVYRDERDISRNYHNSSADDRFTQPGRRNLSNEGHDANGADYRDKDNDRFR
jgi:hypothetical protein